MSNNNTKLLFRFKRLVLLVVLSFSLNFLFGQLNFLVGYGIGYENAESINEVIKIHNQQNPWYTNSFNNVDITHGLYLGVRCDVETFKSILAYKTSGISLNAEGFPSGSMESFSRRLSFKNDIISAGLESSFERVNWGLTLDYNIYTIKTQITGIDEAYTIQKDYYLAANLYLNIDFHGSDFLGFSMQPYVQFPLSKLDLGPFSEELEVPSNLEQGAVNFGLRLILVNGPQ